MQTQRKHEKWYDPQPFKEEINSEHEKYENFREIDPWIKKGWNDKGINYDNLKNLVTEGELRYLFVHKPLKFR